MKRIRRVIQLLTPEGWEDVCFYDEDEEEEIVQHDLNEYNLSRTGLYRLVRKVVQ